MLSQLEALRLFINNNGQPERTIYLAFGHDEEITGLNGAQMMANHLANTSLEYVLDEGSMIIENIVPGLVSPVAMIGVAEKGYLTIKFHVNVTGGHSSIPDLDQSALIV